MNFSRLSTIVTCLLALFGGSVAAAEPPSVVVTIKPLHSLVAGVAKGVFEPQLLIDGLASPHHFQLKPSAVRKLNQADHVFWLGEGLETFLIRTLSSLADTNKSVKLIDIPGLTLLPLRRIESINGGQADSAIDDHLISKTPVLDYHIWLDPQNASVLVAYFAEYLANNDSSNAARYHSNAAAMQARLEQLGSDIDAFLDSHRDNSYLVFHDSFQYFEKRFNLAAAGVISVHPDAQPGAQRIRDLKRQIGSESVQCLFSEPQFQSRSVRMLVNDTGVKHAVIDPLGVTIEAGAEMYYAWLKQTAEVFSDCFAAK